MSHRIQFIAAMLLFAGGVPLLSAADTPPPVEFKVPGASTQSLPLVGFNGVGVMFVKNNRLDRLDWTDAQIEAFVAGVRAGLRGGEVSDQEATRRVGEDMVRRVQGIAPAKPTVEGGFDQPGKMEAYLKEIKKRLRLQEADSGLLYLVKVTGRGARPTDNDTVVITLAGMTPDGTSPRPSISGENVRIKVSDLLPGLREGVQMLAVGSEAIFVLPPAQSFGSGDWPEGVGRGQPLTFAVTLHEVLALKK